MRIIAGNRKGQRIFAPEGSATRPTTDRVREALFNVIEHTYRPCEGTRVLDLFAGSGALGLEALSRGAAYCLFVDEQIAARGAIRRNVEALDYLGCTKVFRRDATRMSARPANIPAPFDLVFCDPPYRRGLGPRALTSALEGGWLAGDALVILECAGEDPDTAPDGFTLAETRSYGDTKIMILSPEGTAHAP